MSRHTIAKSKFTVKVQVSGGLTIYVSEIRVCKKESNTIVLCLAPLVRLWVRINTRGPVAELKSSRKMLMNSKIKQP